MKRTLSKGKLEVVCGSMFSGKTEELIRRLRRSQIAQFKIQVFKHALENRVTTDHLNSHSGDSLEAVSAETVGQIRNLLKPETQIIGIDEVQFYPSELVILVQSLVDMGKHVIVAGLDLDFRGIPFGCMPALMAIADNVTKLQAVCSSCGDDAHFTQRLVNNKPAKFDDPIILVGAQDYYQPRCRECYQIDLRPHELGSMPQSMM